MQVGQAQTRLPLRGTGGQVNADLRQIKTNPKINYERWGRGNGTKKRTEVRSQRSDVRGQGMEVRSRRARDGG